MNRDTNVNVNVFNVLFVISILISLTSSSDAKFSFPNISSDLLPNATNGAWDDFKNFTGCHPGENVQGLSKVKGYFNDFGYIPKNGNFTDDFDETLQSAIKTYQKNFNLNQTGQLDNATLQQMLKPRCGNADIVNGTSTMNSGKPKPRFKNNNNHIHSLRHYTYFPGMPRWTKNDLTYAFLPANALSDDVKAVFATAFDKWSMVIPMTFTESTNYNTADIRIGFYDGDHGDGEQFDGVLGTLAHAFSPENGRFHLDGAEDWVVSGSLSGSTAVDLESVAVHEIGHLLGLGHSSDVSAIMYPTISSGERKVELGSDDIEGIQSLYGSNPSYNGSTSTTSQERESNDGCDFKSSPLGPVGFILSLFLFLCLFV